MMRLTRLFILLVCSLAAVSAQARDDALKMPIDGFFQRADVQEKLGNEVKFYLAGQKHRAVAQNFGEYQSNKKTSSFKKSDQQACEWALLSAFIALRDRALQMGGNAVVNITSNYKKIPYSSPDKFMCGAGKIMAGVTMKGDVVKLK
ncbi:MAG: excinuclease ABC subunit A [Oceanococcus sp.]